MKRFASPTMWHLVLSLFLLVSLAIPVSSVFAQAALKLSIHYVQATPQETKDAYDVNASVSVLDDSGYPLPNLSISNFSVFEDSQPVSLQDVASATDTPINLILVFDTSGSMASGGLQQSKQAGVRFLQKLGLKDQVAIMSFNNVVSQASDFSSNLQSAEDHLQNLQVVSNAGTCLYDAAYKSVELANTLPPGRRAIILLTDGKDETASGKACSSYTVDDAIRIASSGTGDVPIYTIGLGKNIDENVLKRMSGLTGGEFLSSPDNSQLGSLFDKLYQQLKIQYQIKYQSTGTPGPHNLTVEVEIGSEKDQATRQFSLPNFPTHIKIESPTSGQNVSGQVEITTSFSGSKEGIQAVRFDIAGNPISTITTEPYSLVLDVGSYPSGNLEIVAVALDKDNQELARDSISVVIASSAASSKSPPGGASIQNIVGKNLTVFLVIGIVVVLVLGLILYLVWGRKKGRASKPTPEGFSSEEATMDGFSVADSGQVQAYLTVLFSDDSNLIGKKIPVTKQTTRLGRDARMNDLAFEKDRPVSREHATIKMNPGGQFMFSEVMRRGSDQQIAPPTYGTFVNENRISEPVTLFSGDQIRLGNRLKLLFEIPHEASDSGDSTTDLVAQNDDSTADA